MVFCGANVRGDGSIKGAKAPRRSLTRLAISTMPQFVDTRGHRATHFGPSSGRFHDKISFE